MQGPARGASRGAPEAPRAVGNSGSLSECVLSEHRRFVLVLAVLFLSFTILLDEHTAPPVELTMQALRLARPQTLLRLRAAPVRGIAATANPAHAAPATHAASTVIPLSNVEAQWENLSPQEQLAVHQQLEEVQKRDWKTLSLDEKKAGASRSPVPPPPAPAPQRAPRAGGLVSTR